MIEISNSGSVTIGKIKYDNGINQALISELITLNKEKVDILLFVDFPNPIESTFPIYSYPEFVSFRVSVNPEEILSPFAKKQRKHIRQAVRQCEEKYRTEIITTPSESDLDEWYLHYQKFIIEKHKYAFDYFAKTRPRLDPKNYLILKHFSGDIYAAGTIVKIFSDRLSKSFTFMNSESRNDNIKLYELDLLLNLSAAKGKQYISFGKDPNLYGGSTSIGILDFKEKYSTEVYISKGARIMQICPLTTEKEMAFYIINPNNSELELVRLNKK